MNKFLEALEILLIALALNCALDTLHQLYTHLTNQ